MASNHSVRLNLSTFKVQTKPRLLQQFIRVQQTLCTSYILHSGIMGENRACVALLSLVAHKILRNFSFSMHFGQSCAASSQAGGGKWRTPSSGASARGRRTLSTHISAWHKQNFSNKNKCKATIGLRLLPNCRKAFSLCLLLVICFPHGLHILLENIF